jgi:hypothetical protein
MAGIPLHARVLFPCPLLLPSSLSVVAAVISVIGCCSSCHCRLLLLPWHSSRSRRHRRSVVAAAVVNTAGCCSRHRHRSQLGAAPAVVVVATVLVNAARCCSLCCRCRRGCAAPAVLVNAAGCCSLCCCCCRCGLSLQAAGCKLPPPRVSSDGGGERSGERGRINDFASESQRDHMMSEF